MTTSSAFLSRNRERLRLSLPSAPGFVWRQTSRHGRHKTFHDNCPAVPNLGQANADDDSAGDACDACGYGGSSRPEAGDQQASATSLRVLGASSHRESPPRGVMLKRVNPNKAGGLMKPPKTAARWVRMMAAKSALLGLRQASTSRADGDAVPRALT